MNKNAAIVTCLLLTAFSGGTERPPSEPPAQPDQPPFVDKVWTSTDPSAALGSLRVFLRDGTLIMDSCWETYHLTQWQAIGEDRIEWHEDAVRIEAEIIESSDERLVLRLQLRGETKEEAYRPAQIPFICPDMPR